MAKGHLFWSCLCAANETNEIIEIKLEIIDIEACLAETWAISPAFVNGAIKEPQSQTVGFLVCTNESNFAKYDGFSKAVPFVDDKHTLGSVARRNDLFEIDKNLGKSIIEHLLLQSSSNAALGDIIEFFLDGRIGRRSCQHGQ